MLKKIFTTIILIILIVILVFVAINVVERGKTVYIQATTENESTDLLTIQARVKSISETAILEDDTSYYVGEKLEDTQIEEVKRLIDEEIISSEEDEFDSYYIWNQETINSQELKITLKENEYYIVNYETGEVITTNAIKMEDETSYHKLTDLKETIEEESISESKETIEESESVEE